MRTGAGMSGWCTIIVPGLMIALIGRQDLPTAMRQQARIPQQPARSEPLDVAYLLHSPGIAITGLQLSDQAGSNPVSGGLLEERL